jgi:type II secretion system protein D
MESYVVDADKLSSAVEVLRKKYAGQSDVRITADQRTSRLFFLASPQEQQRIASWLAMWAQTDVQLIQHQAESVQSQPSSAQDTPGKLNENSSTNTDVKIEQAGEAVRHTELLRRLGYDVEIEVLPDQDVIVLRGRDVDVEAVAEIIREIERVARLAKPEIDIVPLKHVRDETVVSVIEQVLETLTQGRQGRVTLKALGQPNAILLIGWGESRAVVRGLITKLDLPMEASAALKIFGLRYASAEGVRSVVEQFFVDNESLGPTAKIVPDVRTNTLIVQAAPRALQEVALLIDRLDTEEGNAVKQVRVFPLAHTLASDLAKTLQAAIDSTKGDTTGRSTELEFLTIDGEQERMIRSGLLDDVDISVNEQTNALVVSGPANSMNLIEALIKELDQPIATAQIKVFRVTHGDANSLVLMLRALLPNQNSSSPRPQLPGAEGESSLVSLRFAVEQRTNSIIASGTEGDLRIVEALLLRLDENDTQRRRSTVYRLRNAPALDVARAVNEFLRSERMVQQVAPGEESAQEQFEREVIVVAEPVSNSLIVSATRRFYDEILNVVERLDAQPPQVVIQVLIGQVALNETDEFGVEIGLQDSVLFDRSLLGDLTTTTESTQTSTANGVVTKTNEIVLSATNTPGFNFNNINPLGNTASKRALAAAGTVGTQGLSNFLVGRINNELGFGGLVLSAGSENVSLLIRALQETRRLEVLSRPQITTLDNQQAFIQVGQRVPRVTSTSITTFGQTNSIELDNVGLILIVTPRISPTGMVVMEIDAERSEVGPEVEGIPISVSNDGTVVRSPRIDITTAQTTVSAANGETIILGGLITKRSRDVHRRVPLIADIPLIGDLFRYDLVQEQRSELLIILTPHVVMGPAEMERIRQIESARMHWCAADVHEIHGSSCFCNRTECPICEADVPIIFPDLNPRGVLSQPEAFAPESFEEVPGLVVEPELVLPESNPKDESLKLTE